MKYIIVFCLFFFLNSPNGYAQEKIYSLDLKKDIALTGIGIGMNVLGYTVNHQKATLEEVNNLNENDLWSIDRAAIYNDSKRAQDISDMLLYTSMTIPFIIYADVKCRSEGLTIGLMGLETLLLTNGVTTITKVAAGRYRPFNYNPNVSLEKKLGTGSNYSFFSGHTSVTTSLSFFAAKVMTDLRPGAKHNWLIWTIGATTPAVIGYLRFEAGKHFLTDIITGYAVGAVIGYMVPAVHLNKNIDLGIGATGALDFRLTF